MDLGALGFVPPPSAPHLYVNSTKGQRRQLPCGSKILFGQQFCVPLNLKLVSGKVEVYARGQEMVVLWRYSITSEAPDAPCTCP